MAETDDGWQPAAAETAAPEQAPAVEKRSDNSRALAGAVAVLVFLVPAAFVVGWRLGRTVGRLRGF